MQAIHRVTATALSVFLTLTYHGRADAGEIVGSVVLSGRPGVDVVVAIGGLKLEGPTWPDVLSIDHQELAFTPHVIALRVGDAVRFENTDGMPCRFYSVSPAGMFVLRPRDGDPTTVVLEFPGVIEVRCAEHSRTHAHIVVRENPYFSLTDRSGRYRLSGVPPGHYRLEVWYEGAVVESQSVDIGSEPQHVDFAPAGEELEEPGAAAESFLELASGADRPLEMQGVHLLEQVQTWEGTR